MLRNSLIAVAAVALSASVAAQNQVPVHKAVQPKFAGVYKVAEGALDTNASYRSLANVLFNNNMLEPYYSVPGANQEWVDEGLLVDPMPNASALTQINSFDFTYCSTEPDATGNSGTITITFYDEHVACTGPTFTGAACAYDIVGLPLGDPNGNIQCWIVTIDLTGVECTSAVGGLFRITTEFGWGIRPAQNNTGPWLSVGGNGIQDSFEWFDATNAAGRPLDSTDPLLGCFWFGGGPQVFANFAMRVCGPEGDEVVLRNANGANDLDVSVTFQAGASSTWTINNPTGQSNWLVASLGGVDVSVGGWGLLINQATILPPTPISLGTNSVFTANVPASIPAGTISQMLSGTALSSSGIQASGNGHQHN